MTHPLRRLLEKIASEKAPGPSPTFSVLHILHAIELIGEKTVGRGKLAQDLEVGEGAVRTIIDRLKGAGLIETSKSGCSLTDEGLKRWREYKSVFEKRIEIGKNELAFANYNFAVLIKNQADKVKSGVEQRDAAVIAGAKSATTVMLKRRRLIVPSVSDNVVEDFPKVASQIIKLLKPQENDVIIIASAESLGKARYGALAAAWTLFGDC